MSKQSKQPTKLSIELSELPKVQKNVTLSIQEKSSEIMKSEDFDRIKEENRQLRKKVNDLKNENKNLDEEISVLMQINELFNKELIAFQNQIKELEMKLKIANQGKGKSRADKLLKLPVEDFNVSNKNKEAYHFYIDEESNEKTTRLRQVNNKKTKQEKMSSDDDDSDSKKARKKIQRSKSTKSLFARNDKRVQGYNKNEVLNLLLNTEVHSPEDWDQAKADPEIIMIQDFFTLWAYVTSESENEKVSEISTKRRRVTDYARSIMYSRNSELET
ncbi:25439_t:CDS:2, partial [Gigaspora margarita]